MRLKKDARKFSKSMLRESLVDGRVDESSVRRIIKLISSKKPRNYLSILKNYHHLIRAELEKAQAFVESAQELTDAERGKIENEIKTRHGRGLTVKFATNPELIGGLRVRVANDVWDGSVRNRLARLRSRI